MNQTIAIAAIAHKIIDGNLPIRGMTMSGIDGSIAPKETPFVA